MLTETLLKSWKSRTTFVHMRVKPATIYYKRASDIFVCPECGWCGTMFEAHHFTAGDIDALRSVLKDQGKKILDNWHKNICPVCDNFSLIVTNDQQSTYTVDINIQFINNLLRHY
jgi:hypothetical protein